MARLPRLYIPGYPEHISQRAVHGDMLFASPDDYARFYQLLTETAAESGIALYGYVLLPSEFRLVVLGREAGAVGAWMQRVTRRYSALVNRQRGRSGVLFSGRYRSTPLEPEGYLLSVLHLLEHEPLRHRLADEPAHYRHSSFRHHTGLRSEPSLTDPPQYWALGNTPFERQMRYRRDAEEGLRQSVIELLDRALASSWVLGDVPVAQASRRTAPLPRGRPRSKPVPN